MKIAFCYPPFSVGNKYPTLPQNRQFIYTASRQVKIFPMVMASAATWANNLGHQILWLDGITQRLSYPDFEKQLSKFSPDLIILDSKAPIMEKLWKYINKLKVKFPKAKIILVGDHATLFPEESLKKSKTDFVLKGGNYDFILAKLVSQIENNEKIKNKIFDVDKNNFDLNNAPLINRELANWSDYGEAYLFHPAGYIMSGRGCGIDSKRVGVCNFCIWQHALWKCQAVLFSPEKVVKEVENLINLGTKEIFDDNESGALWNKKWLEEFYQILKKKKLLGKVYFSSNARGDQLTPEICKLLKKLNYRLLKVGLESGSNITLEKIGKRESVEQIIAGVKNAKDAGLCVMLTIMVGYPWEKTSDVEKTYDVAKDLMFYKTKAGDCLQASVITPYPGTPLYLLAKKNKWFTVDPEKYEKFDMSKPVLKTGYDAPVWCQKIWSIQKSPEFILRSGLSIRNFDQIKLLARGAISLLGHSTDYE